MKYIIALLVALSMSVASYAGVVRHGNTFSVETTSKRVLAMLSKSAKRLVKSTSTIFLKTYKKLSEKNSLYNETTTLRLRRN